MNILFVNATKTWGGIKTWMIELAAYLNRRGHGAAVVCRPRDYIIQACAKRGIPCYPLRFGADFSPVTVYRFIQLMKALDTDMVVTNISKDIRTGGVAARSMGIAHVNRLGGDNDLKSTLKTRLIYSLLVDEVIVPSRYLYDHFGRFAFLKEKLRMFHNAVDPPALNIGCHSPLRFAVVAKLSGRKQVDKVLGVFERLRQLPWRLYIGGFGPESAKLKRLARELQIDERVHFPGRIDPYQFLQDKDVGILYSEQESFGYAIIEYMAMSCAVVASRVGGTPEIITHAEDGMLVDSNDCRTLEKALRSLIENPEMVKRLARRGYETVKRHFSQDAIFAEIEGRLQHLIASQKK